MEPIILAKRNGAPSIRTPWIGLISPNGTHSRKPGSVHELIEKSFPGPYTELFATQKRKGWRTIGNEIDARDIRESLARQTLTDGPRGKQR